MIFRTTQEFSDRLTRTTTTALLPRFAALMLAGTVILLGSGCGGDGPPPLTQQDFNPGEIAPFVEPDFPFITTSVDAGRLGPGFPDDNLTPRCLALRLGNRAYACFDTDMLRWSVAWTGQFLPMVTMAQISYRDFHNKDNQIPVIAGDPKIATGLYPGWLRARPEFNDPRPPAPNPAGPSWGPLPQHIGRWNGVYLDGQQVVLDYSVRGTRIHEHPGSVNIDGQIAFTRTFRIHPRDEAFTLAAAEVPNAARSEVTDTSAFLYQGEGPAPVTAVGLAGEHGGATLTVTDLRYATVHVPAGPEPAEFTVVLWKGPQARQALFGRMLTEAAGRGGMPDGYRQGGPARWPRAVPTRGQVAPDTAAYVIDRLTLPIPNPWKRNVRAVDVAFLDARRAAVVTFEGDVWLVDGIDRPLHGLQWRRYASGLYEPQSIEVVRDTIYVFGKEGIVRLHDLNADGEADYYQNFSNLMEQSIETREWASDMVAAPDGSFYVSKFGALDMGPETSSPKTIMGFRAGSRYGGSVVKISPDGRRADHYATGFRGPYLGIHPKTGMLSASDQQGHYMPSTPILLVGDGDYYGVPATAHRDALPPVTPPLTWIPHSVDRSGAGQVWVTGDQMGPLSGRMVHLSYGRPGLFKVHLDSTGEAVQGGVSVIPGSYPAPTMKGAVSPGDGQLYVAGFSLWGSNSEVVSSLIRLRYTGLESTLPEEFRVRRGAILIRFGSELDVSSATDPANFRVKRWNYRRSEQYGSGHYRLDGSPGEELLPVFSAHRSEDGRAVLLAVPDIRQVMQMEVSYDLSFSDGRPLEDQLWFTVNDLEEADLAAEGFTNVDLDVLLSEGPSGATAASDAAPASAERGRELFQRTGCGACHATGTGAQGKVGPPMQGLFGSNRLLADSTRILADSAYLSRSILEPGRQVAAGYEAEMPSFLGILSEWEIEAIVLYIESLSDTE